LRISHPLVPDPPQWFSGRLYHKFFTQAYQEGVQIAQSLSLVKWFIAAASDVLRNNELAETIAADSNIYIHHIVERPAGTRCVRHRASDFNLL
jgi:hypothetical protein